MYINLKKENRNYRIQRALKNNLKKRKIFQNKVKNKSFFDIFDEYLVFSENFKIFKNSI